MSIGPVWKSNKQSKGQNQQIKMIKLIKISEASNGRNRNPESEVCRRTHPATDFSKTLTYPVTHN